MHFQGQVKKKKLFYSHNQKKIMKKKKKKFKIIKKTARKVAREKGVNLFVSPYKDEEPFDLEYCENLLKEKKIKLIACLHASNVIGCVLPVEKIGELAKKYNVHFLVDAAQSAGVLDIDVEKMNINMLALPAHKGLMGNKKKKKNLKFKIFLLIFFCLISFRPSWSWCIVH